MEKSWYALSMAWKYRQNLQDYRCLLALQKPVVTELNPIALKSEGVRLMILDFDGVLAAFGETVLAPAIKAWVAQCVSVFGAGNILILTNRPTEDRQCYFDEQLPGVKLFWAAKKKPYPDGILAIINLKEMQPENVLVVDDRLLTGILAAIVVNVRGCYITKPLVSWQKRPIQELFFMGLRVIERLMFRR
jgi:predicted HAD superfamily phosphohydrolase YqeG